MPITGPKEHLALYNFYPFKFVGKHHVQALFLPSIAWSFTHDTYLYKALYNSTDNFSNLYFLVAKSMQEIDH